MTINNYTFTRFDAIGVREQLSDLIYTISPTEVPFLSNAQVGKAQNTLYEWQTDALASAVSSNQQLEGDEVTTTTAVVATTRMQNYCEIARKTVGVSNTQRAVNAAGRADELNYQVAKLAKELKRDMETSMLANKAAVAGSTSVARKTAGLMAQIKSNIDKASDGTAPVYTTLPNDVWTVGTARAFTETMAKNVIQQCYTAGADTKAIMVGAWNKQVFSGFSGVVELMANQGKSQATIIGAADEYVSDFGRLSVIPNRFQPQDTAFFIDWNMVKVNYLRPFTTIELATTGDVQKRLLLAEFGSQVNNEKGLGAVTALATS